ncbi:MULTISPECIES: hypothetical protein [unclassified Bradyrhizobium]|uniref:hypothetical protein n=1 Tax=unclassified Bradyrhizobium TaxID=2631580 RepID=UPI0028E9D6CD|nr:MULTISPECIES: hypothetical protein [unclassified Bradyrhizobium]
MRAIVTTREAGSDGRDLPQRVFGRADERLAADVKSQGPDTPMLVSSREGARARRVVMVANKPGAPGRLRISVKTVARGMPVVPAGPVVTAACFFSAGGPWVRPASGIPRALSMFGGTWLKQDSGEMRREIVEPWAGLFEM